MCIVVVEGTSNSFFMYSSLLVPPGQVQQPLEDLQEAFNRNLQFKLK